MANTQSRNTFYIDAASSGSNAQSFIASQGIQVAQIIFNSTTAGDSLVLCDLNQPGGTSAGANKLMVSNGVAKDSKQINLFENPIQFANGIWVSSISASCNATLVTIKTNG